MKEIPRTIKLPCYGIEVQITSIGVGSISSDLKEICSYCNDPACDMNCPDFYEHCSDRDKDEQIHKLNERYDFLCHKAAQEALESMILAHAISEVDIESPAYIEGIETAVDALGNKDYSVEVE